MCPTKTKNTVLDVVESSEQKYWDSAFEKKPRDLVFYNLYVQTKTTFRKELHFIFGKMRRLTMV